MYFLSHWIFIVFEFGGIVLAVMLLSHIRVMGTDKATLDLRQFRKAVILLFPFSILGVASFTRLWDWTIGQPIMQLLNNLATGIFFVWFLILLKKSIRKDEQLQNPYKASGCQEVKLVR